MNLKMLVASMLVLAALFAGAASAPAAPARAERVRCTEDMPCWNWATMGNRTRGIVTMWGTMKVVDCFHLRDLLAWDDVDPHNPWLRGDYSCGRRR